jgi:hypothetical protein
MTKREDIQRRRVEGLESEFRALLPRVLKECALGRWGLFGQNDGADGSKYLFWSEAEQLKSMAAEIRSIRQDFGESNPDVERFLHRCSLRGSNLPGEQDWRNRCWMNLNLARLGRPSRSQRV